jgi:hypothetical protein
MYTVGLPTPQLFFNAEQKIEGKMPEAALLLSADYRRQDDLLWVVKQDLVNNGLADGCITASSASSMLGSKLRQSVICDRDNRLYEKSLVSCFHNELLVHKPQ